MTSFYKKPLFFIVMLFIYCSTSSACECIRAIVTANSVSLRAHPSSKSRTVGFAFRHDVFFIENTPVKNPKTGEKWYSILYTSAETTEHALIKQIETAYIPEYAIRVRPLNRREQRFLRSEARLAQEANARKNRQWIAHTLYPPVETTIALPFPKNKAAKLYVSADINSSVTAIISADTPVLLSKIKLRYNALDTKKEGWIKIIQPIT